MRAYRRGPRRWRPLRRRPSAVASGWNLAAFEGSPQIIQCPTPGYRRDAAAAKSAKSAGSFGAQIEDRPPLAQPGAPESSSDTRIPRRRAPTIRAIEVRRPHVGRVGWISRLGGLGWRDVGPAHRHLEDADSEPLVGRELRYAVELERTPDRLVALGTRRRWREQPGYGDQSRHDGRFPQHACPPYPVLARARARRTATRRLGARGLSASARR